MARRLPEAGVLPRRVRGLLPERHGLGGPSGCSEVVRRDLGLRLGPTRRDQHLPDGAVDADPVGPQDGAVGRLVDKSVAELHLVGSRRRLDDGVLLQPVELGVEARSFQSRSLPRAPGGRTTAR